MTAIRTSEMMPGTDEPIIRGPGDGEALPLGATHDGALVFHVTGGASRPAPAPSSPCRPVSLRRAREGYLRELAALGGPPEPATMAELASRYDFEVADS